jgi:hypothetical protein
MLVSNAKRKVEGKDLSPDKDTTSDGGVVHALRTAYEKATEEDIPQDMLDLLGKLQ